MRASIVVMGPLLARLGKVKASLFPAGCAIGGRPINIHLEGFRALGAAIDLGARLCRYLFQEAERGEDSSRFPQRGRDREFDDGRKPRPWQNRNSKMPQGARNCGPRPFLERDGRARLGAGTARLTIEGVAHLHGANHEVIPEPH